MNSKRRRWTEAEDTTVLEMRPEHTVKQIAKTLGRSEGSVRQRYYTYLAQHDDDALTNGGPPEQNPEPEFCINEVAMAYITTALKAGYTIAIPEIGLELKCRKE